MWSNKGDRDHQNPGIEHTRKVNLVGTEPRKLPGTGLALETATGSPPSPTGHTLSS